MDQIGQQQGSIASKVAAAYELRSIPNSDVVVRLCEKAEIVGPSAEMLKDEMALIAEVMRRN